jgi:hypothetical protein
MPRVYQTVNYMHDIEIDIAKTLSPNFHKSSINHHLGNLAPIDGASIKSLFDNHLVG